MPLAVFGSLRSPSMPTWVSAPLRWTSTPRSRARRICSRRASGPRRSNRSRRSGSGRPSAPGKRASRFSWRATTCAGRTSRRRCGACAWPPPRPSGWSRTGESPWPGPSTRRVSTGKRPARSARPSKATSPSPDARAAGRVLAGALEKSGDLPGSGGGPGPRGGGRAEIGGRRDRDRPDPAGPRVERLFRRPRGLARVCSSRESRRVRFPPLRAARCAGRSRS